MPTPGRAFARPPLPRFVLGAKLLRANREGTRRGPRPRDVRGDALRAERHERDAGEEAHRAGLVGATERALAAGSEKAALLVDYAKATAEPDTPEWLLDHGRLPGGKKVADASTREIAEAAKTARAG